MKRKPLRYEIDCSMFDEKPKPVKVKSSMLKGVPILLHEIIREMYRRMNITTTYYVTYTHNNVVTETYINNDDYYFDEDMIDAIQEEINLLNKNGANIWFPLYPIKLVHTTTLWDVEWSLNP